MLKDRTVWVGALVLAGLAILLVDTARSLSATYDEPAYIGCGVAYLEHREIQLGVEHPPLVKALIGAAERAAGVREGPVAAAIYSQRTTGREPVRIEYDYSEAVLA